MRQNQSGGAKAASAIMPIIYDIERRRGIDDVVQNQITAWGGSGIRRRIGPERGRPTSGRCEAFGDGGWSHLRGRQPAYLHRVPIDRPALVFAIRLGPSATLPLMTGFVSAFTNLRLGCMAGPATA
jgi:hypothetical protein